MHHQEGSTLIELIVAMAIVALISGLMLPYISPRSRDLGALELARTIQGEMVKARSEAISKQRSVQLTLHLIEPRRLFRNDQLILSSIPRGIRLETRAGKSVLQDNLVAKYVFYDNGTATGGSIVISDSTVRDELFVNWLTGTVERRSSDALHAAK
jgi:type II secretory pathway pseudopilin PulG